MRCSICDRQPTRFIYGHEHCQKCVEVITETIGKLEYEGYCEFIVDPEFDSSGDGPIVLPSS